MSAPEYTDPLPAVGNRRRRTSSIGRKGAVAKVILANTPDPDPESSGSITLLKDRDLLALSSMTHKHAAAVTVIGNPKRGTRWAVVLINSIRKGPEATPTHK